MQSARERVERRVKISVTFIISVLVTVNSHNTPFGFFVLFFWELNKGDHLYTALRTLVTFPILSVVLLAYMFC